MDHLFSPFVAALRNASAIPMGLSVAAANIPSRLKLRAAPRRVLIIAENENHALAEQILNKLGGEVEVASIIQFEGQVDPELLSNRLAPERLRAEGISGIIVSPCVEKHLSVDVLLRCRVSGIPVLSEMGFWETTARRVNIDCTDIAWFLEPRGFSYNRLATMQKQILDLLVAVVLLAVTAPVMLVVALLIRCTSRGPALYRQERIGRGGRPFTLYKFRTMRQDAEATGEAIWATVGDTRVTRIGKFLRHARLDELPQLLNVLRGEMSMIGPRPERPHFVDILMREIPLYTARHCVKPGITGWAQVSASYGASIEDARVKLEYDLYYIKRRGFLFDMLILFRTFRVMLSGEGAR